MTAPTAHAAPLHGASAERGPRYLIVRLGAIGDVVMASTLVEAIRARDVNAHISWLCGAAVADLVRSFAGVDEVLVADDVALLRGGPIVRMRALVDAWRALAARRFDMILLGHADWRYRAMLLPVRRRAFRALEPHATGRMIPVPGRYYGDEYVRLLDEGSSRGPITGHAELASLRAAPAVPLDGRPVGVVLVPGGARNVLRESALRRWPVERYRAVAEALLAGGQPITLVGDASDAWVRGEFAGLAVRDEIGTQSLLGTLRILERADLVITHDTGPLHLAALVRAPLLGLFGPTMPMQFMPRHARAHVLWGGAELACRPCYDGREFAACASNLCMQDVSVESVVRRARALLVRAGPLESRSAILGA